MGITVPAYQYHFIGQAVEANRQKIFYCVRRETGAASAELGCLFLYSSIGGQELSDQRPCFVGPRAHIASAYFPCVCFQGFCCCTCR
jgi:hypothetical protein